MRVLFVDDEPMILRGIERMLFDASDDWEIVCVEGGPEALEELADEPYDVIVTDMRMPGMDGAAVLKAVHDQFPGVVRIVLSGYADDEMSLRAAAVAHQFLAKPCGADRIKATVERACELQRLLDDERLRRLVGEMDSLPSLPRLYAQLTQVLARPASDADDVAEVVVQDPAMCAKLLQLVNSSFFARGRSLSDVQQAIVRLGIEMVKNLALQCEAFAAPELRCKDSVLSIQVLQRHSLHVAAVAKRLVDDRAQADDAFMAGLLHDVGKLIMAAKMPEQLTAAVRLAEADAVTGAVAEERLLGVSHAEMGAYLLGVWGLPYPIVEAVANHHHPARIVHQEGVGVREAVYLANCLVGGETLDPELADAWGVADKIQSWSRLAQKLGAT